MKDNASLMNITSIGSGIDLEHTHSFTAGKDEGILLDSANSPGNYTSTNRRSNSSAARRGYPTVENFSVSDMTTPNIEEEEDGAFDAWVVYLLISIIAVIGVLIVIYITYKYRRRLWWKTCTTPVCCTSIEPRSQEGTPKGGTDVSSTESPDICIEIDELGPRGNCVVSESKSQCIEEHAVIYSSKTTGASGSCASGSCSVLDSDNDDLLYSITDNIPKISIKDTLQPGPEVKRFPPIPKDKLIQTFQSKIADDKSIFRNEFQTIPPAYQCSTKEMGKGCNKAKNRWDKRIVTLYDHNRVNLRIHGNSPGGDYIQASHVKCPNGHYNYIAAQGPLRDTIADFWRMIWEQNCHLVVMMCHLYQDDVELVSQYWPDAVNKTVFYDMMGVKLTDFKQYADYCIRTLQIWNTEECSGQEEAHTVHQFHYTKWRSLEHRYSKCPVTHASLLQFIKKIHQYSTNAEKGPPVVHCSAGTGETGVYIATEILWEQLRRDGHMDIYNCLAHLRQQRSNLIHFMEQYVYVYRTIIEAHTYGDKEVDAQQLTHYWQEFKQNSKPKFDAEEEFQKLESLPPERKPTTKGHKQKNANRNRYPDLIVPFDSNIVDITPRPDDPDKDYINASWIDGYYQEKQFIVTQDPQKHTAPEFWRMIWEHEVKAVVMLTQTGYEPLDCYKYWPAESTDDGVYKFGSIQVEYKDTSDYGGYIVRSFNIWKSEDQDTCRTVEQYHYHEWPDGKMPDHATGLIDLISQLRKTRHDTRPVTVHCSGGGDRSSVFCALALSIDKVIDDGKVDVPQITHKLREQRQYMVPSFMEYEFIYKALVEYIETFDSSLSWQTSPA